MVTLPLKVPTALSTWKPVGPLPPFPPPTKVIAEPAPKIVTVVGPDAEAAGAAIAAAITGTDQAAPLTILRRLRPPSSLLVTSAFRTSDNCAPTYFGRGQPSWTGLCFHRFSPAVPTFPNVAKGSRNRFARFAQGFLCNAAARKMSYPRGRVVPWKPLENLPQTRPRASGSFPMRRFYRWPRNGTSPPCSPPPTGTSQLLPPTAVLSVI